MPCLGAIARAELPVTRLDHLILVQIVFGSVAVLKLTFRIGVPAVLSGPCNTRPLHRSKAFERQIPYQAVNLARIPNKILLAVQNNRRTHSFFVTGQRCVPPQPFIESYLPPLNSSFGCVHCRARREQLNTNYIMLPENGSRQGQNRALTVLFVPNSLCRIRSTAEYKHGSRDLGNRRAPLDD